MKSRAVLFTLLLALAAVPADAAIQYFGYHASGEDDASLGKVKGYTNFSYISVSDYVYDPYVPGRVAAMNQRGIQGVVELGKVLWCDYDQSGFYRTLCGDWQTRWTNWKNYNAAILVPGKTLALVVRDEPFNWGVSIYEVEAAAARIKQDLAVTHPTVKIWLLEAACVVARQYCGMNPELSAAGYFDQYTGTLPNIDWIGLNAYFIHPETDSMYQTALNKIKTRFPAKQRIYNMDQWWTSGHEQAFGSIYNMGALAQEYYRVAQADSQAIALGVTTWMDGLEGGIGSKSFPCSVLAQQVAIGRAIIGKTRGSAPIGSFSIDANGLISGWTCDPDQTICEQNPWVNVYVNGGFQATVHPPTNDTFVNLQCGTDTAFRYKYQLPRSSAEQSVTVRGADGDSAGSQIASTCPGSPACSWTPHLQYFGYVGSGDDAQNRGLDETKGFTNFSHIAANADLTGAQRYFVRDRVTAMAPRGIKATIDLGLVLWCGAPSYRFLCGDWAARWETWKANNASVLTSDKVLAFAILDGPFNRRASMSQYEAAAAKVKTDFPWAKIFMIEAACVIYGDNCGLYPGYGAFNAYTGSLPNVDWIGLNGYAIHPATDNTYLQARTRLKQRFPGRKWVYVMDGYWDAAHSSALGGNMNSTMRTIAREWHDVAKADFDSILLGVFLWSPLSGATSAKDFSCTPLAEHRQIGRDVTGKVRGQTGLPTGRLENIYSPSGIAVGYACDPDGTICEDPVIDFYREGSYFSSTNSYPSRYDYVVNPQCGVGVAYRFRQTLSSWASGYKTTAVARDLDSGSTTLPSNCADNPACLWFTNYYQPWGYMDGISPSGVAWGWACDPDAPHRSNQVRLATGNGTQIGVFTTNLANEQAVADECGGGYLHRFSVQLPSWARYWDIYAYSQDFLGGEVQIPWLCEPGWYCVWY